MNVFGRRLRNLRKSKNWLQEDLANRLGISRSAIAQWERGHREPDFNTALTLARMFEVSLDYLLGLEHAGIEIEVIADDRIALDRIDQGIKKALYQALAARELTAEQAKKYLELSRAHLEQLLQVQRKE